MADRQALQLSMEEARGLMLAAQGLLDPPAAPRRPRGRVGALIDRLGVLQIDTISVVERTQYLVLWSRLGAYDPALLDALLYPEPRVSSSTGATPPPSCPWPTTPTIAPRCCATHEHIWRGDHEWMGRNPEVVRETLEAVRARGPVASADFERAARRATGRTVGLVWLQGEPPRPGDPMDDGRPDDP